MWGQVIKIKPNPDPSLQDILRQFRMSDEDIDSIILLLEKEGALNNVITLDMPICHS